MSVMGSAGLASIRRSAGGVRYGASLRFPEELANVQALNAAAALVTVVGAVLRVDMPDAELASFILSLHAPLEECVSIMVADRN